MCELRAEGIYYLKEIRGQGSLIDTRVGINLIVIVGAKEGSLRAPALHLKTIV